MISTQPFSKAEWASQQLGTLWNGLVANPTYMPTEFELKRIEKSARDGLQVDPAIALSVFGLLSVLKNDPEGMCRYNEQAIQASPNDSVFHSNYGAGLLHFGNFRQAYKTFKQIAQNETENPVTLKNMFLCCLASGRFQDAFQLNNRIGQLQPNLKYPEPAIQEAVSLLKKYNISDDDVEACLSVVGSIFWENKVPVMAVVPETFYEGNDCWVGLRYDLLCSAEKATELEWELADRLPDGPDAMQESNPHRWVIVDFRGGWIENGY